jgi:tetratricopeptide (TPR) repeat protein
MEPDKLVIFTTLEGNPRERELSEERLLQEMPESVTRTRELMGRFPPPVDERALDSILKIRDLHRQSEGYELVNATERFRKQFGWNPRVEWFRILGLELIHSDQLIGEQRRFLNDLYEAKNGDLPRDATPTQIPLTRGVLDWAIGANHANLMEWLWRAGRNEEALVQFPRSLQGLEGDGDNGRRIERYLYKASCLYRLGQAEQAREVVAQARAIDEREFERLTADFMPLMKELENLMR